MKTLIITEHIGQTAPGRVFETLIKELMEYTDLTILTTHNNTVDEKILLKCNIIPITPVKIINKRWDTHLNTLTTKICNESIKDYILRHRVSKIKFNQSFDLIIALCSAHCLAPLGIANKLKEKFNSKLFVYLVDACPTPIWWGKSFEYEGIINYLKKYTDKVDLFISSNERMLEYQKPYLSQSIPAFDVLYPMVGSDLIWVDSTIGDASPIFLYTGSIYGIRTIQNIYEAFGQLVSKYKYAKLIFVGTNKAILNHIPENIKNNVEVLGLKKNLIDLYSRATALIDIDANVEYDVFLSSKVTNYLLVNRPIICETGKETPARDLFKGIDSVLVCGHNSKELLIAMETAIKLQFNFEDRKEIIQKMSMKNRLKLIFNHIENFR